MATSLMNQFPHIKITGIDLRKLINAVYAESQPVGLGALQAKPGPIPNKLLEAIVGTFKVQGTGCVLSLDYVLGRAVKFQIFRDHDGDLLVRKDWHDHNDLQLRRALREAGLKEIDHVTPGP